MVTARGRAKVNLTLRIVGRRPDGWHELHSLVAFAGYSDWLRLAPHDRLSLTVHGPTARAAPSDGNNLVLRAAEELRARYPDLRWGAFHLTKRLPVSAGLGGGSVDAAAALRLLAQINGIPLADPQLFEAARAVGADVSVCLLSQARIMSGVGDRLGPPLALPKQMALLVTPAVPLETSRVFAQLALRPGAALGANSRRSGEEGAPARRVDFTTGPDALLSFLRSSANDLEDAATVLKPVIGDVIAVLSAARGCRLARMSGSGPTCFGLFADCHQVVRAATVIRRSHPEWLVVATTLQ
jgi:4-diphosphocytidyl-2-C-methyl-D-erythritol kinase